MQKESQQYFEYCRRLSVKNKIWSNDQRIPKKIYSFVEVKINTEFEGPT